MDDAELLECGLQFVAHVLTAVVTVELFDMLGELSLGHVDEVCIGLLFPKMWWNQGLNLGPPAF